MQEVHWLIRVIGKQRKEIDKDLLVQAVLALSRQLREQQRTKRAGGKSEFPSGSDAS